FRRQPDPTAPDKDKSSIANAFSTFRAGVPQIYLNIDREKAETMGVKVSDIFNTLQANLGSVYVNDFNKFGRTYQVRVQAGSGFPGPPSPTPRAEVPGPRPAGPPGPGRKAAGPPAGAAGHAPDRPGRTRPAVDHPLQPVPDGHAPGRDRPGRQFRPGPRGDG